MSAIGSKIPTEHRNMLAFILRTEKSARLAYKHLMRCGAMNLRPDHMLVRNAQGTYDTLPDYGAWNCYIPRCGGFSACLIRHRDGEWMVHS
jgi:hypothetical protein